MKQNISPARTFAYKILYDVLIKGAFSNVAINRHMNAALKNDQDRKLAVQIVYGTIKKEYRLNQVLEKLSSRDEIHPVVKTILLMSLYQIIYLDKVPEYAIVNDAVNLCKFYKQHAAAAFANGVLRNALRKKSELIHKENDRYEFFYYEYGFPKWLVLLLEQQYEKEFVKQFIQASEEPADVFVRTNTQKISTDHLIESLRNKHIGCEQTYVPESLKLSGNMNFFHLDEFRKGLFLIQDLSGMIAGYVLDPKNDDLILDICSAPGGKTFHASILSKGAQIVSCDVSAKKLELLKLTANQLGLEHIRVLKRDATVFRPEEKNVYDKIICDVPCSGIGVIKRKPEILKRITKEHIDELVALQKAILNNALHYLKPGGTLIYSTCTINQMENMGVVNEILSQRDDVSLDKITLNFGLVSDHETMKNGYLQLTPMQDQCDGFFIARLRKK